MPNSLGYRFVFKRTRGTDSAHEHPEIQLSEVNLYDEHGESILLPGTLAVNPAGSTTYSQQAAPRAIDGLVTTKWVDTKFQANDHHSVLELILPTPRSVSSYNFWTGNDVVHRDPSSWTLQVRLADGSWAAIDEKEGLSPPMERQMEYAPSGFPVPEQSFAEAGWTGYLSSPPQHLPLPPQPPSSHAPPPSSPLTLLAALQPTISLNSLVAPAASPSGSEPNWDQSVLDPARDKLYNAIYTAIVIIMVVMLVVGCFNVYYLWGRVVHESLQASLGEDMFSRLSGCCNTILGPLVQAIEFVRGEIATWRRAYEEGPRGSTRSARSTTAFMKVAPMMPSDLDHDHDVEQQEEEAENSEREEEEAGATVSVCR